MGNYQVLIYRKDFNLGDCIQVIALSRLLPGDLTGVYRDNTSEADPDAPFVVSGWLGSPQWGRAHPNPIFAGVHIGRCHKDQLLWISQSKSAIGARDPYTKGWLARSGVASDMIGCPTMTFERYAGTRVGKYSIDVEESGTTYLTQELTSGGLTWHEIWTLALTRLGILRRAEIVYTNRLHVALPCLAFGTPLVLRKSEAWFQPERLSLLDALQVRPDEPTTVDLRGPAAIYVNWLAAQVGHSVLRRMPTCPVPRS